MKAYERKKLYRCMIAKYMKQGLVNDAATGQWRNPQDRDGSMAMHMRNGSRHEKVA